MRRGLPLLAVLCLAFAPAPFPRQRRPDASKGDLQAIQGKWDRVLLRIGRRTFRPRPGEGHGHDHRRPHGVLC